MNSSLRNPRHEQFALLVAGGINTARAYTAAGFRGKGSAQSASRLARRKDVAGRISELSKQVSKLAVTRAAVDREWVLSGLRDIAENSGSDSARVRAYQLCGNELGMFKDSDEQLPWDGRFESLTPSQLEIVMAQLAAIAFGDDKSALEAAQREALSIVDSEITD